MKLVDKIRHKEYLTYTKTLREMNKENATGYEFIDANVRACIEAGILIEPKDIDELEIKEVIEVHKAVSELIAKCIKPDTKN